MPLNQEDAGPILKTGRWLRAEEDGLVCLVNARALITRRALDQGAYVFMGPWGQKIRLQVPRIRQSGMVLAETPDAARALAANLPQQPGADARRRPAPPDGKGLPRPRGTYIAREAKHRTWP